MANGQKMLLNISKDITRSFAERIDIEYTGNDITNVSNRNGIQHDNELQWLESFISKLDRYKGKLEEFYSMRRSKRMDGNLSIKLSYIYLMLDERNGYYKIGRSLNPEFRERTLQAEAPQVVKIFNSPLTYAGIEQKLHIHFKEKRIRGEWFRLNDHDVNFVKSFDYGT